MMTHSQAYKRNRRKIRAKRHEKNTIKCKSCSCDLSKYDTKRDNYCIKCNSKHQGKKKYERIIKMKRS